MYDRVLALGFPLGAGSYPERRPLQVDREVTLRAEAGVAVAVARRTERLRLAGPIGEPVVVLDDLQRPDVEPDLAVVRRAVADALVDPVRGRGRANAGVRRPPVDVDGVVFDQAWVGEDLSLIVYDS